MSTGLVICIYPIVLWSNGVESHVIYSFQFVKNCVLHIQMQFLNLLSTSALEIIGALADASDVGKIVVLYCLKRCMFLFLFTSLLALGPLNVEQNRVDDSSS